MENVTLLTDSVNAITPLLDFTAVTGLNFRLTVALPVFSNMVNFHMFKVLINGVTHD